MNWNKEKLEEETQEMQIRVADEIEELGLPDRQGGRPRAASVEISLGLSPQTIENLDKIAKSTGSTRRDIMKTFILNGMRDFYRSQKTQ